MDSDAADSRSPKRRRLSEEGEDRDIEMVPRYVSPDDDNTAMPPLQDLSIQTGRQTSRNRAVSSHDQHEHDGRFTPVISSPPRRGTRSRSQQQRRDRSYSRSELPSRSRTHSRSQTPGSDRSESRSRSQSPYQSRSQSPSYPPDDDTNENGSIKPNYTPHLRLAGHEAAISQVRLSPDGKWIASASADGTARIWDAATGAHMDTLVGHMAGVSCIAWAPDSEGLATGGDDKAIRLWDRVTASPAHAVGEGAGRGELDGGYGSLRRVKVGGGFLRKGAGGKGARGTKNGRGPLLGHHNYLYCLAFSPKGNILASGSYDEAVFLWDVRAGRLMRSLPAHSDPVSGIDFSRDGTLVASCSTDGLIRLWDTSTGQCLRTLVHEDNPPVTNVCFSPNGRFILAFNMDNCIRMWDYVAGSVKKTYQGHKNSGFSIGGSFGRLSDGDDGQRRSDAFIASASEDGDIVLWDVKSKEVVQRISQAHKGVCFWVDVNGDTMVSCGRDGVINVFRHRGREGKPKGARRVNGVHRDVEDDGMDVDDELQRQIQSENTAVGNMHMEEEEEEEL